MENNFDSAKWIREFKTALFEEKEKKEKAKKADDNMKKKGQAVHSKDLLHTTKVDDKKADKVDMKIGAENDLAIEKDKDGHDVYARGLKEAFEPGNMWSDDFDYNGMLRYSVNMEIPEDPVKLVGMHDLLLSLFNSYTDVNYHSEARDLGNAIDHIEGVMPSNTADEYQYHQVHDKDLKKAQDLLKNHKMAAAKTLKDITKGKM